MQVGIGVDAKNYQSPIADNKKLNNDLRTSKQNALSSSHDNESIQQDASSFSNLRNPSRAYQFNKSTSLGNLSFINVVGLPYHPRQQSVPSTTSTRNKDFPIHCRNVSEPNTTPVKAPQPVVPFHMNNNANIATNIHLGGTSVLAVRGTTYSEPCWKQSCITDARQRPEPPVGSKQVSENVKGAPHLELCWNQNCGTMNNTDPRLSTQSSVGPRQGGEIVKGTILSQPCWNQACTTSSTTDSRLSTQSSVGPKQGGTIVNGISYSQPCWNQTCSTSSNTDPRLSTQSSVGPKQGGEIVKGTTYSGPCWNQNCITTSNGTDPRLTTQFSVGPKQGDGIVKGTAISEPCWNQNCVTTSNVTDPRIIKQSSVGPKHGSELIKGTTYSGCWNQTCSTSTNTDPRVSLQSSIGPKQGGDIVNNNKSLGREQMSTNSGTSSNQTGDNVSNVNVNFYRAVPMNVMSAVPAIQCTNTQTAKNVSNVQIMPLSGSNIDRNSSSAPCRTSITSCQVTVQNEQPPTHLNSSSTCETVSSVYLSSRAIAQRTFTSTEAQTDDTSLCELGNNKERRRRERRERRHNRRTNPVNSRAIIDTTMVNGNGNCSALPDILDSHIPPPYTTHPNTLQRNQVIANMQPPPVRPIPHMGMIPQPVMLPPPQILGGIVPPPPVGPNMIPHPRPRTALQNTVSNSGVPHVSYPPPNVISGQIPIVQNVAENNSGFRFALPVGQFSRDHFSEESPKSCCGVLTWKPGSLKWLIASVALVAVGCVLVGTALGTMRPAGRDHFTIALLMIGIGIVLVTISGVAWRLASQNATSCRTMLGIGSLESVDVCTRRFVPRLPPTYGRPHHPYAAMMYPEFQYRPPPPTYQASMQEYRLRLLLIDRGNTPQIQAGVQNGVAPPPTYRSHSGSLIRDHTSTRNDTTWSEYSCPPSYRSQAQLGTIEDSISVHTRDPSLSISERTNDNTVEVVNILRNPQEEVNLEGVELVTKTDQDTNQYKLILEDCGGSFENDKEDNLVTIVQTDERSPVIVTVSGNSSTENTSSSNKLPSEIQILAHL